MRWWSPACLDSTWVAPDAHLVHARASPELGLGVLVRADGEVGRGRAWLMRGGHLATVSHMRAAGEPSCCVRLGADPVRWVPREVRRGGLGTGLAGVVRSVPEGGGEGSSRGRGEKRRKKKVERKRRKRKVVSGFVRVSNPKTHPSRIFYKEVSFVFPK